MEEIFQKSRHHLRVAGADESLGNVWEGKVCPPGKGVSTNSDDSCKTGRTKTRTGVSALGKDFFRQCSEILECGTAVSEQNHYTDLKQPRPQTYRSLLHLCNYFFLKCLISCH